MNAPSSGIYYVQEPGIYRRKPLYEMSGSRLTFPDGSAGKESACSAGDTGDTGSIPASGRSPGEGNGNLLQYSCQENPMDRGIWQVTVYGVAKSQTRLK